MAGGRLKFKCRPCYPLHLEEEFWCRVMPPSESVAMLSPIDMSYLRGVSLNTIKLRRVSHKSNPPRYSWNYNGSLMEWNEAEGSEDRVDLAWAKFLFISGWRSRRLREMNHICLRWVMLKVFFFVLCVLLRDCNLALYSSFCNRMSQRSLDNVSTSELQSTVVLFVILSFA